MHFPYLFQDLKVNSTLQTHYILFLFFMIVWKIKSRMNQSTGGLEFDI